MSDDLLKSIANLPSNDPVKRVAEEAVDASILDLDALALDIAKQQLYSDKPVEAFVGEALSSATLGASDVVARALGVPAERLSEVREQSPTASTAGAVSGLVAGALASGGASVAAKTAGAGFKAATAAGKATEKALQSVVSDKIRGAAAQKVLSAAARGVGEGAAIGVGEAISDVALERKELTAQNVVASAGAGALLGAGFGAAFGTAAASMPKVKAGFSTIGSKVKTQANRLMDPVDAAVNIVAPGRTSAQLRLKETLGEDLVEYFNTKLNAGFLKTADDYVIANEKVLKATRNELERVTRQLDEVVEANGGALGAKRLPVYGRLLEVIENLKTERGTGTKLKMDRPYDEVLKSFSDDIYALVNSKKPFSYKEFDSYRKKLQDAAFKDGTEIGTFKAKVANSLRARARQLTDELATEADAFLPGVGQRLKQANKDAHVALSIRKPLAITAQKGSALPSWSDVVEAGVLTGVAGPVGLAVAGARKFLKSTAAKNAVVMNANNSRRKLLVLADLQLQQEAADKTIRSSFKSFFSNAPKKLKPVASPQVLVNSGFALNKDTKKVPKTKRQAFMQVSENLRELVTNPDLFANMLARTTARIAAVSPIISQEAQSTIARAVAFLSQKLPKDASPVSAFAREYVPADFEIAKFERYLQAVEQPYSVLQDLEQGTLTREHVEALQAVYPDIYLELQTVGMAAIADNQNLPYNKKLQIATLLGLPGDSALEPDILLKLQENFAAQDQAQPVNGNVKATQAAQTKQLNIAGRSSTDVQKLQTKA